MGIRTKAWRVPRRTRIQRKRMGSLENFFGAGFSIQGGASVRSRCASRTQRMISMASQRSLAVTARPQKKPHRAIQKSARRAAQSAVLASGALSRLFI